MNNLQIINQNGNFYADSREVAEMVEKPHNDLMKSIRQYCEYLTAGSFPLSEFFIESDYKDSTGRTLPCYLITRKGCDMVANKMTGQKGVLFTATYVTEFDRMEKQLAQPILKAYQPKATSLGEVANFIKTMRSLMKENNQSPEKIAEMAETICKQFNINIPANLVRRDPFQMVINANFFLAGK